MGWSRKAYDSVGVVLPITSSGGDLCGDMTQWLSNWKADFPLNGKAASWFYWACWRYAIYGVHMSQSPCEKNNHSSSEGEVSAAVLRNSGLFPCPLCSVHPVCVSFCTCMVLPVCTSYQYLLLVEFQLRSKPFGAKGCFLPLVVSEKPREDRWGRWQPMGAVTSL